MILSVDLDWIRNAKQSISLFNLLLNKFKTCDKIIFIKSHNFILKYFNKNTDNTIYNIDHHHDFGYGDYDNNTNFFREGNWVDYLISNKFLKNYYWINNIESELNPQHIKQSLRELDNYNHTINLNICEKVNFSKIIICESFEYNNNNLLFYNFLLEICNSIYENKVTIDETKNITKYTKIYD
jgi:hypothetical protein